MKIGITTFGADKGQSGIGRYTRVLIRELTTLASKDSLEVLVHKGEQSLFIDKGAPVSILPIRDEFSHPAINLLWHQTVLPLICRRRGYDALFIPAGNRRLPCWLPCPSVGTVHDFSSIHVDQKYDPVRMIYIKRFLPRLVRQLTRILTVSESSKRDIVELAGISPQRVIVTPLAADRSQYFPRDRREAADRISAKYGIPSPYILYISRIEHPGKNHVRLIRAFEQLKEKTSVPHKLVLAGTDKERAEEVHQAADQSVHRQDILFTGFVAGGDLPDFYCAADLFVFPSLYEGFGLPVLESMSCGTPVACSDISSIPEVAGNSAQLFDPHSEASIFSAMSRVLRDSSDWQALSRKGLRRAETFDWKTTAQSTLEVIRSTMP